MNQKIRFSLNNKPLEVDCRADMTVLEWLRGEALLRGTKEGCAEGDCGACSVLVSRSGPEHKGAPDWVPANSCIMLMGQLDGGALVTVEGLAECGPDGHAVQARMAENGSSQCGFCTPGIVVALTGLLDRNNRPEEQDIHDALAGNLCRCTGYRPIVEAVQAAASDSPKRLPRPKKAGSSATAGGDGSQILQPGNLRELTGLLTRHRNATLLAGGTDISIDVAHAKARWPKIISTRCVEELRNLSATREGLTIGAAVTWEEILPAVQKKWPSLATLVRRFGSVQVRSMGTIGGNLATASPIGDGAPGLIALSAEIILASSKGERTMPLEDFFRDYRKTALRRGEVIRSVFIPAGSKDMRVYKVSKRYDQDISTVCGAFNLRVAKGHVADVRIAFGGMAATPVRARKAEKFLTGKRLESDTVDEACRILGEEFTPMTDMRGDAAYRSMVAANLFHRYIAELSGETVEVMAL